MHNNFVFGSCAKAVLVILLHTNSMIFSTTLLNLQQIILFAVLPRLNRE